MQAFSLSVQFPSPVQFYMHILLKVFVFALGFFDITFYMYVCTCVRMYVRVYICRIWCSNGYVHISMWFCLFIEQIIHTRNYRLYKKGNLTVFYVRKGKSFIKSCLPLL